MSSRFGIIYAVNFLASRLALAAILACAAGCFSFETASTGSRRILDADGDQPIEHVVVANNGWYLFNAWPLACGNARRENGFCWTFFRNDVDMDLLHGRLTRHAKARGCDVKEINIFNDEEVFLSIPGLNLPLPLPYIITFREQQISGVLVKHPTTEGK